MIHARFFFFFFNDTATTEIYTLSLHDALPIALAQPGRLRRCKRARESAGGGRRTCESSGRGRWLREATLIFGPMLSVTFLGTSAARPTVERNVSGVALVREGETLLFECGEGTQRQMMRYGVSFALSEIFFTHFHADHFLGVIGLIRTLGLQARVEPMRLYGPRGAKKVLGQAIELGVERVPFKVEIEEVKPGTTLRTTDDGRREGYEIHVFGTEH